MRKKCYGTILNDGTEGRKYCQQDLGYTMHKPNTIQQKTLSA